MISTSVAAMLVSDKPPRRRNCRVESDMAECLQGSTIALLAADGVGQTVLDASGDAVRQAGAHTQLLGLRAGQIQSVTEDLDPGRVYTVERAVTEASSDEYEALLLLPGMVRSHQ